MKLIKLFIRIVLSPIFLIISLIQTAASFLIGAASWILGIISFVVLAVSIFWFATEGIRAGMTALVLAVLLSPIGIPMVAQFIVEMTKLLKEHIWRLCH